MDDSKNYLGFVLKYTNKLMLWIRKLDQDIIKFI